VNSEGAEIRTSQPYYRLFISALTKADDGMELPRYESFFSFTPDGLPDDDSILKVVEEMVQDLEALRVAPVVDPYTGPAILSGRASAVFFHEILGHRVEGHRQKEEDDAQTFKKMVNRKVLPERSRSSMVKQNLHSPSGVLKYSASCLSTAMTCQS